MNIFQKITPYRSDIARKLLTNDVIVKLLNDMSVDKEIGEMIMPEDVYELYKTKIFTRTNVDGLVGKEDCYVMLSFPVIMPLKNSNTYSTTKLVFNVMCHKEVIDMIVAEMFDMFDDNTEFGFEIKSPIVREGTHKDYFITSIEFDLVEFTKNR